MDLEIGAQRNILEPKTRSRKSSLTSKKDPIQVLNALLPIKSEPNVIISEDSNSSDLNSALLEDDASQSGSQNSTDERSEPAAGALKKGRWSKEEDELLLSLVQTAGTAKDRWVRIAEQIPGRVHRQCRDRYSYLQQHEGENKRPWSDEEDAKIIDMLQKFGKAWREIGKALGRSPEATKNHYHAVVKRKMEKENRNPQFIHSRIGPAEPPAKTASPAGSALTASKEPAPKARILQSPLPKSNRPASAEKRALATSSEQINALTKAKTAASQEQHANKAPSLPQSKAQTLDQVILEQKASSLSNLFGSPKNLSGKATTRFRLVGSTIQFEKHPAQTSVSADQLDVSVKPVVEQKPLQSATETTKIVSPANATRNSSASKLKSKRKLFGEEEAGTSASETVKIVDESFDRSNIEECSSVQASNDVNSSVSEMDLTLQHQSVDASLNQSVMMSPNNTSLLDDSLTSPGHTTKLNLSQLNLGSPTTFKNKPTEKDSVQPAAVSQQPAEGSNINKEVKANGGNESSVSRQLASSTSEIPKAQQTSAATSETAPASKQESSTTAESAESKLKARSKSLTDLFSQSQLNTIMAAPAKPVVPAVTLGRSVSAQVIPGFKISLKKKEDMKKPYSDLVPPPPPPPPVIPVVASVAATTQTTALSQQEEAAVSSNAPEAASEEPAKPASAPTSKGKRGRKRKSSLESVKKKIDFEGEAEVLASGSILESSSNLDETSEPPKKKLRPSPVTAVRASRRSSRLLGEIPKFPNLESVVEEKTPAIEPEQQVYIEQQDETQEFVEQIYTDITGIELDVQSNTNLFAQGQMLVPAEAEEAEMFTGELHLSCNEELDVNEVITSTQGEAGAADADAVFADLLANESDILGEGDVTMDSAHLFGDFAEAWY